MTIQTDLHGLTIALERNSARGASSTGSRVAPRSFTARAHTRLRALLRRGDEGSALVEFALILPMLLLITTGIMIFGVAMNNYLQLTNAVSMGARYVATRSQLTKDPCADGSSEVIAAAPGLTSSKLTFNFTFNGISYPNQTSCSSTSITTGAAGNLASGTNVTVNATYPLNLSVFGKVFNLNNAVLSASSTELVQ
jgi:Flp pilus assembly protein TadG